MIKLIKAIWKDLDYDAKVVLKWVPCVLLAWVYASVIYLHVPTLDGIDMNLIFALFLGSVASFFTLVATVVGWIFLSHLFDCSKTICASAKKVVGAQVKDSIDQRIKNAREDTT